MVEQVNHNGRIHQKSRGFGKAEMCFHKKTEQHTRHGNRRDMLGKQHAYPHQYRRVLPIHTDLAGEKDQAYHADDT